MHNSTFWFTLLPLSVGFSGVFRVYLDGDFASDSANNSYGVRPVVYFSAEVQITGGDGSQNNPYTIE